MASITTPTLTPTPFTTKPRIDVNDTASLKAARKAERHQTVCVVCGKPSTKRCTKCLVQKYCSRDCRKYDLFLDP